MKLLDEIAKIIRLYILLAVKAEYTISVGYTFIKERYNGRSYSVCT